MLKAHSADKQIQANFNTRQHPHTEIQFTSDTIEKCIDTILIGLDYRQRVQLLLIQKRDRNPRETVL